MSEMLQEKRGQAMVEFAITIPFFVIVTLIGMYVMFALHDYFTLQEIAREAARQRAVYTTEQLPDANLRAHIQSYASLSDTYSFEPTRDLTVTFDNASGSVETGDKFVAVTAVATKAGSKNVVLNILPDRLSYSLVMRQEW